MTWAYKQMYEEGNESNRGKSGLKVINVAMHSVTILRFVVG